MRPKIAIQTGTIATSRAAIPDGTVCSPQATMPIPPPRSRAPTIALSRHSRRLGAWNERPPRATDQVSRISPASTKRIAAMRNGGIVSTAIAIPRYVEPQTTYSTSMPSQIAPRSGAGWWRLGIGVWSKGTGYALACQAATATPESGRQTWQGR